MVVVAVADVLRVACVRRLYRQHHRSDRIYRDYSDANPSPHSVHHSLVPP